MKKFSFTLFVIFTLSLSLAQAQAKMLKMIFLYPGGQGSQEEAQPVLDEFAKALKKASKGKIDAKVWYFSDQGAGIQFIQNQKPALGILSQDLFLKSGPTLEAEAVAQTLQLPQADGTDQFFILGASESRLPSDGSLSLISSRPLDQDFIKQKLFPQISNPIEINPTSALVSKLRKIGQGKLTGFVLLSAFEYKNISRLQSAWAKNLIKLAESKKVKSAPVVIFSSSGVPVDKEVLKKALLKLSKDGSAKETLQLLRLKGFR